MDLYYFLAVELDIQPLSIAFKWILYWFVGVLEPAQVLDLWDRILAYESMDYLAITAAALFSFQKNELLSCTDRESVLVHFINSRIVSAT
jgi:hypothetical protein